MPYKNKMTFKQRIVNFWYYHKKHTLLTIALIIVFGIMVTQCAKRVEPDYTVVLYMRRQVSEQVVAAIETELSRFGEDLNNDGKTVVELIDCSYNPENVNSQIMMGQVGKLQGTLSMDETFLFISDSQFYIKLDDLDVFEKLDYLPDKDGKALNLKDTPLDKAVNGVEKNYFAYDYYLSKRRYATKSQTAKENEAVNIDFFKNIIKEYK